MKKFEEGYSIRILVLAIAVLLFGGVFSVWAVSTQETVNVGVGDIYEVDIQGNEELESILQPDTGSAGNIEENKNLFNVSSDEEFLRGYLTGDVYLYNAGEVDENLNELMIELKAEGADIDEEVLGTLTLSQGSVSFDIQIENGWDGSEITIDTTGNGSYTKKEGVEDFELHFLIQIDEVQQSVISQENVAIDMVGLEIDSTSGGSVTEPGEGTFEYEHGSILNLEAMAEEDSPFVEWIGDNETIDDPTSNQTTIEMLDNYVITAVFDVETYELSVESTEGGSVEQPGEGNFIYDAGEIVDLEAVPEEGYHFVEWTGDTAEIDDPTSSQTTIEMLDDYAITAEFVPVTYDLTIDSTEGGSVEQPGEGTFEYDHGSIVDLEAVAEEESSFVEWTGDVDTIEDTTANQTTIEMLDNYVITAVFDVETYELTVDSTEGGSVEQPGEGTYTYDAGASVDLEAVADEGYHFVEWTGDTAEIDDPTSNQTTIEMLDNYAITAEFAPTTYELTIDSTEGGSVEQPGEGTFEYEEGELVGLEAVADEGYQFGDWTGDIETIDDPTSNQTTVEMLDNYAITAEFLQDPFFEVEIVDHDDTVIEEDTVTVDYIVTNTGEVEDTQDIGFTVEDQDGNIVRSVTDQDVNLSPGEVYDETFSWTTEEGDAGEYDLTVTSEDDEEMVIVTVYATAMEINDTTATYVGDPGEWLTHWEATDVYVEGLDAMDLIYHYDMTGTTAPGPAAEAGVRILVDGAIVMEVTTNGELSEEWEGTADVSGLTEVDIQFQYYTETQGGAESEVTINQAGYEYVDTTSANWITEFIRDARFEDQPAVNLNMDAPIKIGTHDEIVSTVQIHKGGVSDVLLRG